VPILLGRSNLLDLAEAENYRGWAIEDRDDDNHGSLPAIDIPDCSGEVREGADDDLDDVALLKVLVTTAPVMGGANGRGGVGGTRPAVASGVGPSSAAGVSALTSDMAGAYDRPSRADPGRRDQLRGTARACRSRSMKSVSA